MAFRFSVRALFELSERPYFWTFTMKKALSIQDSIAAWNRFQKLMYKWGRHPKTGKQTIFGLRVFELHPGGHGLHVHVLFNRFININIVRRYAEMCGYFWIDVTRIRSHCEADKVADYLTKYLSKQERAQCLKGRRLWAAIGKWGATKCKNIVVESEFVAAYHARRKVIMAEAEVARRSGTPYRVEHQLETMAWAHRHCWEVRHNMRAPLTDKIIDITEPEEVTPDYADWDAAFDELVAHAQQVEPVAVAGFGIAD